MGTGYNGLEGTLMGTGYDGFEKTRFDVAGRYLWLTRS